MKYVIHTPKGLLKYSIKEAQKIGLQLTKKTSSTASFEAKPSEAYKYTYKAQCIDRILLHIDTQRIKKIDDIEISVSEDITKLIQDKTYRVTAQRKQEAPFSSINIEKRVGHLLCQKGIDNVDLTRPQLVVRCIYEDNKLITGIDIGGKDLSKREYKVFSNKNSINPVLGASFLQHLPYQDGDSVVNPFCRDGVLPIELAYQTTQTSPHYFSPEFSFEKAGLLTFNQIDTLLESLEGQRKPSTISIHSYDRHFRNIKAHKKNAKIAGVQKEISFSRFEPEFLDLKFPDKSVDIIYGRPEQPTRHTPEIKLRHIYHDLFRYGQYSLKDNGKMIFMTQAPHYLLEHTTPWGLVIANRQRITYKHLSFTVLTFERL